MKTRYQPRHVSGLTGPVCDSHIAASLWIICMPETTGWEVYPVTGDPLLIEIQEGVAS